jgi:hypothetical protein
MFVLNIMCDSDQESFDYNFYLQSNPDLQVEASNYEHGKVNEYLWYHWCTYGESEDRPHRFLPCEYIKPNKCKPLPQCQPNGPQGYKGIPGNRGPSGPQGPQGIQGIQGDVGGTGPQGLTGEIGPQGLSGPKGDFGGPQGLTGEIGPQGPSGPAGAFGGPQGVMGSDGPQGPEGPGEIQTMFLDAVIEQSGADQDFYLLGSIDTIAETGTNVSQAFSVGNNHVFIYVKSINLGISPQITVNGVSITEDSGTPAMDSEILIPDNSTNQYYQTSKKWYSVNSINLTGITNITYEYGHIGYGDLGNRNFTVQGYRAELRAQGMNSEVTYIIQKVQDDGGGKFSLVDIENMTINNNTNPRTIDDSVRSGPDNRGWNFGNNFDLWPDRDQFVLKQGDFNTYFTGDENIIEGGNKDEGIIVIIRNPSNKGPDLVKTQIRFTYN